MKSENIITLTANAIKQVASLQKNNTGVFYIGVKEAGCNGKKYVISFIPQADRNVHEEIKCGDVTCYVDKESIKYIEGMELDCINKSLGQWQWEFRNPHAKSSCGCGESFNIEDHASPK